MKKVIQVPLCSGFHLFELLIATTIICILATMTVSFYSPYITQARRLEAGQILLNLAIAMEEYHIRYHSYENATLATLHFPERIVNDAYQLVISSATTHHFLLIAKPLGKQANDHCKTLTLDSSGRKAAVGSVSMKECW